MLFVIAGPSCVGKSYAIGEIVHNFRARTVVPFTTRLPRDGEAEGVHYHFRSEQELRRLSAAFTNGYWVQPFGVDWYGYTSAVDAAAHDHDNVFIIHAYSEIALRIRERYPDSVLVLLDFERSLIGEARIRERFAESPDKIEERLKHAEHERAVSEHFHVIKDDDELRITDKLRRYIEEKVRYLAPRIYQAGPLSDTQLLRLIESNRSGFHLKYAPGQQNVSGWTIDLTLSNRLYIPTGRFFRRIRRLFRRPLDLARIDDVKMQRHFVERRVSTTKGFVLLSDEFVLASSNEELTIPSDMAGLVTGRSSYSRLGISVEFSQNILQPGHQDVVALQIKNNLPFDVVIYPDSRIAQVALFRLTGPSSAPYSQNRQPKYLGSNRDIRSRIFADEFFVKKRETAQRGGLADALDIAQISVAVISLLFAIITGFTINLWLAPIFGILTIVSVGTLVSLFVANIFRRRGSR
jgi:deoxycytidine triphosphate deaminase